jgi:serine protease inhibitor
MTIRARGAAVAAVITSSALACGCAGAPAHRPAHQPARSRAVLTASQVTTLRGYGAGDTAFGLNLLSALCRSQPASNAVISPVSLATGLGMAYLGARGKTATAMARVLHLPATGPSLAAGLAARAALLASLNRPGVTFRTSNRIWADPTLTTRRSFVTALRAGYQAGLTHLPLLTNPELARTKINAAVAAETSGHITDLLPPDSIPPGTIGWVLTDALYLHAAWKHGFDPTLTAPGSFSTSTGTVTAKYMNGGSFPLIRSGGWTAVSLPYRGGRLSMLAILPPAGRNSASNCQPPAASLVSTLAAGLATSPLQTYIALPKVKLASSYSLQAALTSLGMGTAFSSQADFSGISPQACCIGFVRHAATMAVMEKGTVASAATAVGVESSSARVVLSFDRPYMLVLRDSLTGEPLMLAWVANPASS